MNLSETVVQQSGGRWVLVATILGSSMAFIDGTVVNVALPAIQRGFGVSLVDLQWVVEAYALFLSALLLLGGALGDLYGRRAVFAAGVFIFAAASAWCGLAPTIGQLIVARAVQGVGGALLVPESLALISSTFPPATRGAAIGTWSGFSAITAAAGPLIGGWLVEHVSWRAAFLLNLPIAAAVLIILFSRVRETHVTTGDRRLDVMGSILVTAGLSMLVAALLQSPLRGWDDRLVLALLAGAIISMPLFLAVEARAANPIVPLHLFRSTDFLGANLVTFFLYASLSATFFLLPLNLIQIQGYSATAAGAASMPLILLMFLLSRWSGSLVATYGARRPLIIGPVLVGVGYALFAVPGVGGSYWVTFFPGALVLGFGMSISVAPLTTTVMSAVDEKHAGTASGVNNAVSRMAGLIAIAVLGAAMLHFFRTSVARDLERSPIAAEVRTTVLNQSVNVGAIDLPPTATEKDREAVRRIVNESFVHAFRIIMLIAGGLAWSSAAVAWLLIGRTARHRPATLG
jgi:EmrB/QacA subfamily drug resistance transporter